MDILYLVISFWMELTVPCLACAHSSREATVFDGQWLLASGAKKRNYRRIVIQSPLNPISMVLSPLNWNKNHSTRC